MILRGGKEAAHSSRAIVDVLLRSRRRMRACPPTPCNWWRRPIARPSGISSQLPEFIDVAIPRGGEGLIRRVADEAKMPVIKHFTGNCHVYVDARGRSGRWPSAITDQLEVPAAGRVQRGRVAARASRRRGRVPAASRRGAGSNTASKSAATSDARTRSPAPSRRPTKITAPSISAPIISVKVVDSLDEAIEHINRLRLASHRRDRHERPATPRGSSPPRVDSAAVMVNASTRFNDGGEFGLGRGNRHQHRQVSRPRAVRAEGTDDVQVDRVGRWADSAIVASDTIAKRVKEFV